MTIMVVGPGGMSLPLIAVVVVVVVVVTVVLVIIVVAVAVDVQGVFGRNPDRLNKTKSTVCILGG